MLPMGVYGHFFKLLERTSFTMMLKCLFPFIFSYILDSDPVLSIFALFFFTFFVLHSVHYFFLLANILL